MVSLICFAHQYNKLFVGKFDWKALACFCVLIANFSDTRSKRVNVGKGGEYIHL